MACISYRLRALRAGAERSAPRRHASFPGSGRPAAFERTCSPANKAGHENSSCAPIGFLLLVQSEPIAFRSVPRRASWPGHPISFPVLFPAGAPALPCPYANGSQARTASHVPELAPWRSDELCERAVGNLLRTANDARPKCNVRTSYRRDASQAAVLSAVLRPPYRSANESASNRGDRRKSVREHGAVVRISAGRHGQT